MKNEEANNIENKELVKSSNLFPVVGIGASSGGLDAFKKFIKAIPENSGMAYVFVQHLHPEHESFLTEILQKVTKIPVVEITDDIKVEPNHIYIIPSNKMLIANDGVLELSPRPEKSLKKLNLPIDLFFASLAEIHQVHAIGIVLSGSGADGTVGLQKIKDHGGIVFAQSEASAAYDSMPANAIQSGVVDFILPPEDMPAKLLELVNNINLTDVEIKNLPQQDDEVFRQILSLLRIRKGTDFTYYKQTTIRRRILRRMALNKNEIPADYLLHLQEHKTEQDTLYQDLLIPVTSFFRDSKIFNNLCESVFPQIIKNQSTTVPIRVWVAGCSNGQEAYSIAICLKEFLGNSKDRAQVFATDISEPAIAKARAGIYTKAELEEVSSQRLQEFFKKTDNGYRVNKEIRDMCVFAVHNFLKDPPFNKIDFISCRNVLIYMEPYLQKKALTTFHYALNSKCFLLLGRSETSSAVPTLFFAAEKHDKLFLRKEAPSKFLYTTTHRNEQQQNNLTTNTIIENMQTDFQKTADDLMLSKYTPAGVVVNEAMDIVHFRGNTSIFLEQAPGKPSHNLLKMAKNGLAFELRNIIHKAKKENNAVVKENIPIQVNGKHLIIAIEATPLPNVVEPHFLILFHDNENSQISRQQIANTQTTSKLKKDEKDLYIVQIEKELAQTREDMRSITEDQETANEELQTANEELLSGSEELQSLNEELETSKEELQSSNEELTVVNQELISLNEQVTTAQQFAESIVDTLREPLLVLDKQLRVKTANKAFYKMFHVTEKETEGNLLYDLGNNQWDNAALRTMLEDILPQKETFTDFEVSHEFPTIGKRTLLLNARELKGIASAEKLILLVMEDVTEQEKYRLKEDEFLGRFKNVLLQVSVGIAIFKGLRFYVEMANESFLKIIGKNENDFVGKLFFESMPDSTVELESILINVFKTGIPYYINEKEYSTILFGKKETGYYNFVYQPVYEKDGSVSGIICVANDITEIISSRKKMEENEYFSRNIIESSPDCVKIMDDKGHINFINTNGLSLLEIDDFETIKHKYWWQLWGDNNQQIVKDAIKKAQGGKKAQFQLLQETVKGTPKWWDVIVLPMQVDKNNKSVTNILSVSRDITEQRKAIEEIENNEILFRTIANASTAGLWMSGENLAVNYVNQTWVNFTGKTFKENLGLGWMDTIIEEDKERVLQKLKEDFAAKRNFLVDFRLKRFDGEICWCVGEGAPRYLANGNFAGYVGTCIDISQRKENEIREKELLTRFQNMVTFAPVAILILKGKDHIVELANEMYLKMIDKDSSIIGKPFLQQMPILKSQGVKEDFDNVIKTGEPFYGNELEFEIIRNDKIEKGFFNFVYQPVKNNNGIVTEIIAVVTEVTEQVLARKKVELSEHRYHNMIYTSPSLIAIFKGENMIIEIANDAIIESWGKGKNVIGRSLFEVIPETIEQGFDKLLYSVYKTGEPVNCYELPINMDRKGKVETMYYTFIYQAQRNVNGEIEGVAVIANEVTPQAILNKKIKASEEQFRMLVLQAPVAICVLRGEDYVIEVINETMAEMLDRKIEEVIDKPLFKVLAELIDQGFKELLDNVYKNGERFVADELPICLKRNGNFENAFVKFIYEPMHDPDGNVTGVMALALEITEQVVGRKKIEESEKRFRMLTNAMPQQITNADAEGNVLFLNQQWMDDTGFTFDELINVGWIKTIHSDDIELVKINWHKSVTTGNVFDMEFRIKNKNGVYKWYLSRAVPINDEQGKIIMWVGSNTDIQNQKEQKELLEKAVLERTKEIEQVNKELALQNVEKENRTQELGVVNKELVFQNAEKEKRAVELGIANKELTAFNYISSHDLQEPLRKIQTFASLIIQDEYQGLSDNAKDYFRRMQDSANRMQALITDLLAYSRTNTTDRQFEQINLDEIIKEAIYELADTIDITKTIIKKEVAVALNINKFQFKQLAINLIANAIKFSKQDTVTVINISAKIEKGIVLQKEIINSDIKLNPKSQYCMFRFSDNGIGFDPQYKDKIFELFQRLHGNASYAGTGIGLAIVKKIVENHNGFITADGILNEGAIFTIYLPTDK